MKRCKEVIGLVFVLIPNIALDAECLVLCYLRPFSIQRTTVYLRIDVPIPKQAFFLQETKAIHARNSLVLHFVPLWQVNSPYKPMILLPKQFVLFFFLVHSYSKSLSFPFGNLSASATEYNLFSIFVIATFVFPSSSAIFDLYVSMQYPYFLLLSSKNE